MNDPRVGRHDAKVAKGVLTPAEKRVSFLVARELELGVQLEGVRLSEVINLDGVVDGEIDGDARLYPRYVLPASSDRRAHRREVDEQRDSRKVL